MHFAMDNIKKVVISIGRCATIVAEKGSKTWRNQAEQHLKLSAESKTCQRFW